MILEITKPLKNHRLAISPSFFIFCYIFPLHVVEKRRFISQKVLVCVFTNIFLCSFHFRSILSFSFFFIITINISFFSLKLAIYIYFLRGHSEMHSGFTVVWLMVKRGKERVITILSRAFDPLSR